MTDEVAQRGQPKKAEQTVDDPMASIRAILAEAEVEIKDGGELDGVRYVISTNTHLASEVTRLTAEVESLQPLADEVKRLGPLADDGTQYRTDLIEAAITEGIRAMGDKFPQETYREMFKSTPLDQIKRLLESWGGQPHEVFISGGRQTVDDDEKQTTQRTEPATPSLAYAAA